MRRASSCSFDPDSPADGGPLEATTDELETLFKGAGLKTSPIVDVAPRGCTSLTPAPDFTPTGVHNGLNESNLSYRVGADYTFRTGTLLYASDNVGYKSGIISPTVASTTAQFQPVKQERVDAYEVGFKTPLFEPSGADQRLPVLRLLHQQAAQDRSQGPHFRPARAADQHPPFPDLGV